MLALMLTYNKHFFYCYPTFAIEFHFMSIQLLKPRFHNLFSLEFPKKNHTQQKAIDFMGMEVELFFLFVIKII